MAEAGLLKPDARVELIDGQINDLSPIGPFHGSVTKRLNLLFTQNAQGRWLVAAQDPLHLNEFSEPQPDLMLLRPRPDFYRGRHPGPEDVFLLVEVSDTSREYDRANKIPVYGQAAITEVWLIDLQEQAVEVYREPHVTGYSSVNILRAADKAFLLAFPGVAVDLSELFHG